MRPSADDEVRSEARTALLNDFRDILVRRWPGRISMETILGSAGLAADKYIVDTPRPEDCWYQALKRIQSNNKLLKFIAVVKAAEPNEVLDKLYALEEERQKEAPLKLQAELLGAFTRLLERLRFATNYAGQLRKPEHLETTDLGAIKDYLTDLYRLLDELREILQSAPERNGEIAQASDIEARTNKCTDVLQLYTTLMKYAEPADDPIQLGGTVTPGDLGGRANDEIVLLQAKAGLRNALIRLGKAGS